MQKSVIVIAIALSAFGSVHAQVAAKPAPPTAPAVPAVPVQPAPPAVQGQPHPGTMYCTNSDGAAAAVSGAVTGVIAGAVIGGVVATAVAVGTAVAPATVAVGGTMMATPTAMSAFMGTWGTVGTAVAVPAGLIGGYMGYAVYKDQCIPVIMTSVQRGTYKINQELVNHRDDAKAKIHKINQGAIEKRDAILKKVVL